MYYNPLHIVAVWMSVHVTYSHFKLVPQILKTLCIGKDLS